MACNACRESKGCKAATAAHVACKATGKLEIVAAAPRVVLVSVSQILPALISPNFISRMMGGEAVCLG